MVLVPYIYVYYCIDSTALYAYHTMLLALHTTICTLSYAISTTLLYVYYLIVLYCAICILSISILCYMHYYMDRVMSIFSFSIVLYISYQHCANIFSIWCYIMCVLLCYQHYTAIGIIPISTILYYMYIIVLLVLLHHTHIFNATVL